MARIAIYITIALLWYLTAGCTSREENAETPDMTLVCVGDSTLTLHDVQARIPAGLSAEDSTAMFAGIVETWLQDVLLRDVASENMVDMEKIDRLTREYRERLIVNEYMQRMKNGRAPQVSDAQVHEYYDRHGAEMLLEQPLIQGVYIKVNSDADHLDELRRWMRSATNKSVDNIEKYGLKGALHYDYFKDRWVDWSQIAATIPYKFGDPDTFVRTHTNFETTVNGSTYILHISDRLATGQQMPYSFAAPIIRESLSLASRDDYGSRLLESLTREARSSGRLRTPGYDLAKHTVINEPKKR